MGLMHKENVTDPDPGRCHRLRQNPSAPAGRDNGASEPHRDFQELQCRSNDAHFFQLRNGCWAS